MSYLECLLTLLHQRVELEKDDHIFFCRFEHSPLQIVVTSFLFVAQLSFLIAMATALSRAA